jgi:hypothetical protein
LAIYLDSGPKIVTGPQALTVEVYLGSIARMSPSVHVPSVSRLASRSNERRFVAEIESRDIAQEGRPTLRGVEGFETKDARATYSRRGCPVITTDARPGNINRTPWVWIARDPPHYPDYPFDWMNDVSMSRHGNLLHSISVASGTALDSDRLLPIVEATA